MTLMPHSNVWKSCSLAARRGRWWMARDSDGTATPTDSEGHELQDKSWFVRVLLLHHVCIISATFKSHNISKVCKTLIPPPLPTNIRTGLTLIYDLLTWQSIVVIYGSRTIYLPIVCNLFKKWRTFFSFSLWNKCNRSCVNLVKMNKLWFYPYIYIWWRNFPSKPFGQKPISCFVYFTQSAVSKLDQLSCDPECVSLCIVNFSFKMLHWRRTTAGWK